MAKLHFIISLIVVTLFLSACDKKEAADQLDNTQASKVETQPSETNPDTADTTEMENNNQEMDKSLKEFENRKIYHTLNSDIIKTIKDDDLEQAILDYVLLKIDEKPDKAYEIVTALPEGYVTVFATMEVEGEVNNGGFDQYFSNTSGEFALEAIEGFEKIGAKNFATITKQALNLSLKEMAKIAEIADPDSPSKSTRKQDEASANNMQKLDNQFYDNEENISDLRIKYIRENTALFDGKAGDSSGDKKAE